MYIDRIIFPVTTLGIGNRVAIWTIGCPRRCVNCSNPELQNIDESKNIDIDQIIASLLPHKDQIDGITITGGDPFFQSAQLCELLTRLSKHITDNIIVFTGYTLQQLQSQNDDHINECLKHIAILIDGEYIDELNDGKGLRGSTNQVIHILNNKYIKDYQDAHLWKRQVQNIFYNNNVIHVGIPISSQN